MLVWALVFLALALICALLGFTTVAGASLASAKILFLVFVVLALICAILHFVMPRGRP